MKKTLHITMPDRSVWAVPTLAIAYDRAKAYKDEFGGDVQKSLDEDTLPLFADDYEVIDWAANNMNWSDVVEVATRVASDTEPIDYQEGWVNGEKVLVD